MGKEKLHETKDPLSFIQDLKKLGSKMRRTKRSTKQKGAAWGGREKSNSFHGNILDKDLERRKGGRSVFYYKAKKKEKPSNTGGHTSIDWPKTYLATNNIKKKSVLKKTKYDLSRVLEGGE